MTAIEVAFIIRVIPPESARGRTRASAFGFTESSASRRRCLSPRRCSSIHTCRGCQGGARLTGRGACDTLHSLGPAAVRQTSRPRHSIHPRPRLTRPKMIETELSKIYDHTLVERRWYDHWEKSGYFRPREGEGPSFVALIPPPNVTGSLTIGHAFNHTIQDVLTRWQRMTGVATLW